MNIFWSYYLMCFFYCMIMSIRRWNRDVMSGGLGITPGLDIVALLIMCWALAPIDLILRWIKIYKDAEEARRNNTKVF